MNVKEFQKTFVYGSLCLFDGKYNLQQMNDAIRLKRGYEVRKLFF